MSLNRNSEQGVPLSVSRKTSGARFWRGLPKDEHGQTLVIVCLCMTVLIAFLGLAIDVGKLRYEKRQLQLAADAAAIAGALEISQCGGTANCSAMTTAAQDALTENGFTGSSLLTNCAIKTGKKLEIAVNNPPCAVSSDPNISSDSYVEVIVSDPVSTIFASVLGIKSILVAARSEAAPAGGTNCIYALDPSSSGALTVAGLASLTTSCGIVVESNSSSALLCELASVSGSTIAVVGGIYKAFCSISGTTSSGAVMPSVADPLSSLAAPTVPACGSSTASPYYGSRSALTLSSGTYVLYPTYAYCGGITIKKGAKVTFEPGTYVLGTSSTAGGLTIDVGGIVNGSGVTFYNYGSSGGITLAYTSFTSGEGVSLVAPTSGTYSGILFFQASRNAAAATIIGSSSWNTILQGAYYFPSASVTFAFDGAVDYNILVAYDITFAYLTAASGTSSFTSNYSSLAKGSPLGGSGASLVE